uniref:Uncharacterized protein n=1 Tax=Lotus japonicus TaxID=34305 RepID=I3SIB8_LOTJA|nr:unknown [Lotus japonicus]
MVEVVKRFHDIYIINKDTAVRTPIESHTKRRKPFLTSSIPNLQCEQPIFKLNFLGKKIRTNCSLILITKLTIHILIHQGCFTNPAISEDYDLE